MNASERFCTAYTQSSASIRDQHQQLPWLKNLRENALHEFAAQGLPKPYDEDWKYTNLKQLEQLEFCRAERPASLLPKQMSTSLPACEVGYQLVFVNGWYMEDLSTVDHLPSGLVLCNFAQALSEYSADLEATLGHIADREGQPFAALNTAFMEDGVFLRVAADTVIHDPIHCLFLSTASADDARPRVSYPRLLILLEDNAEVSVVEHYLGIKSLGIESPNLDEPELEKNNNFTNTLTEIQLHPGASLNHYKLQCESCDSSHIAGIHIEQQRGSRFTSHNLSLGAALARNDIRIKLTGENARCCLNGVYLVGGHQHIDNHTQVDHLVPSCCSEELYKGVIQGRARAVFNGKVVVEPDAQQSDARQINKNLLLSEKAEVDSKPELQIFADDVKCSHGATVGQLDARALFYLQSRGISKIDAQALLVYAFVSEILEAIDHPGVQQLIQPPVLDQLSDLIGADSIRLQPQISTFLTKSGEGVSCH